eukprot:353748-Lingulodinium_polyedra.AAC.1
MKTPGRPSWRNLPLSQKHRAVDGAHWRTCRLRQSDAGCLRCKMIWWAPLWKCKPWAKIDPHSPSLGSWIGARKLAQAWVCIPPRASLGQVRRCGRPQRCNGTGSLSNTAEP